MTKTFKEGFQLFEMYPDNKDTCVLLFSENPIGSQPREKYTLRGVVRMNGYGNLTLEEKLITYNDKLAGEIDKIRNELQAPQFGFVNLSEAQQMLDGVLDNAVSRALRIANRDGFQIFDIVFKDNDITVLKPDNQNDIPLLQSANGR
jgi:hypothetical protein